MPVPTKDELRRFCQIDGWDETKTDHWRYKKTLPNGDILRTRVPFGRGSACDDPALWTRIWRYQLGLESEDEFWETLKTGNGPTRGATEPAPQAPSMPTWLADYLIHRMGRSEDDVLALGEEEAMKLYMDSIGAQDPSSE